MRPAASRTPAPSCHVECLAVKPVGELDTGTSSSMSEDGKRSDGLRPQATAPILDSTRSRLVRRRKVSSCPAKPRQDCAPHDPVLVGEERKLLCELRHALPV